MYLSQNLLVAQGYYRCRIYKQQHSAVPAGGCTADEGAQNDSANPRDGLSSPAHRDKLGGVTSNISVFFVSGLTMKSPHLLRNETRQVTVVKREHEEFV